MGFETSPLFEQSFYLPPLMVTENYFEVQSEELKYFWSLSYEILFYAVKNISVESSGLLIKKIAEEISVKFTGTFFWRNDFEEKKSWGNKFCNLVNFCLFPKVYIDENAYKLSRLIERLGNYLINEKSTVELKDVYLKLLGQFLSELLEFALEDRIKSQLGQFKKGNYFEKSKPFLKDNLFENLAIRFIQLLPLDRESIPKCTFDIIFELKHQFPEKYELVSAVIESFKQTKHCTCLENLFKIERSDVKTYFFNELENNPDASFQYPGGKRVYGKYIESRNVCELLMM